MKMVGVVGLSQGETDTGACGPFCLTTPAKTGGERLSEDMDGTGS